MILPILILFSCQDEILSETDFVSDGEYINFGITDHSQLDTRTRVSDYNHGIEDAEQFVLRSEDSADTLCIRAEVTVGINLNAEQGKTRATTNTQITDLKANGFGVFAYWKKANITDTRFLMYNEQVKHHNAGNGETWFSDNVYHWPGTNHKLRFFGYSPYNDPDIVIPQNTTNPTYELFYTVPQEVKNQKDILVSMSEELPGNTNQAVPMTFKHACSAIKFTIGKDVQPGTITSITVKGVYDRGTYLMQTSNWRVDDQFRKDFTLNLNLQVGQNASQPSTLQDVLLMIPQQLPKGACIEVAFKDKGSKNARILTAPIEGSFWNMGKTTNYIISISPEYILRFDQAPVKQDAHFVIYPIKVHVDQSFRGEWTITSNNPANLTLRKDLTKLEQEGYWIEPDKGTASIKGTEKGDFLIYAFLTENAGNAPRTFTLTLSSNKGNVNKSTFTITQNCPLWIGNVGSERIEEFDSPWGYAWTRIVTYTSNDRDISPWADAIWINLVARITGNDSYVNAVYSEKTKKTTITIDYKSLNDLGNIASSGTDGYKNTTELKDYKHTTSNMDMENYIDKWLIGIFSKLPTYDKNVQNDSFDLSNFAVKNALMKNRFYKEKKNITSGSSHLVVDVPVLRPEDFVWFLPASNEYAQIKDTEYPLNGIYWTSTAVPNSSNTYIYTATNNVGTLSIEGVRMQTHKIRAMRRK